jgi:hypothetical protein
VSAPPDGITSSWPRGKIISPRQQDRYCAGLLKDSVTKNPAIFIRFAAHQDYFAQGKQKTILAHCSLCSVKCPTRETVAQWCPYQRFKPAQEHKIIQILPNWASIR